MRIRGFTLIELVIAIGLAAIFIPAIVYVFSFSLGSARQGESYSLAYTIAQEQMEAIYFLKENDTAWDWVSKPENTGNGEYYQPKAYGSGWILGAKTSNPVPVDGYTATVEILPVRRNSDSFPDDTGSPDYSTRKVVVKVSWEENGVPTDVNLVSYVTKH